MILIVSLICQVVKFPWSSRFNPLSYSNQPGPFERSFTVNRTPELHPRSSRRRRRKDVRESRRGKERSATSRTTTGRGRVALRGP